MSQINQKKSQPPQAFGPLNNRKPNQTGHDQTVGNTYGERRDKADLDGSRSSNWVQRSLQWGKDLFLGGVNKSSNVQEFSNSADRYEGVNRGYYSTNPIVEGKSRIEKGTNLQARVQHPEPDKYVGFLDSLIHYIDADRQAPAKKKV